MTDEEWSELAHEISPTADLHDEGGSGCLFCDMISQPGRHDEYRERAVRANWDKIDPRWYLRLTLWLNQNAEQREEWERKSAHWNKVIADGVEEQFDRLRKLGVKV